MSYASAPGEMSSIASPSDADAFCALNEEWISRLFAPEDEDRAVLGDPFGRIVASGGDVLVAREPGGGAVAGRIALLAYPDEAFELAKMGFVRIPRNRLPLSDYHARADVLMELM